MNASLAQRNKFLLDVCPGFVATFLKKVLRVRRLVHETSQGRFFIDPVSHFGRILLCDGTYEPEVIATLAATLQPGDTFLDIGANEGFFSVVASKLVGPSGRVISIEPQSRLQSVIARNLVENSARNVEVHPLVISDSVGWATLHLFPDINTGGSGLYRWTKYPNATEKVPQTTLSQLLATAGVGQVKLMKLDVESFEHEIILGSPDVFARGLIGHIALELHPQILARRGKSEADIINFLIEKGYRSDGAFSHLVFSKS
jgi:FkbM family methyltransferase